MGNWNSIFRGDIDLVTDPVSSQSNSTDDYQRRYAKTKAALFPTAAPRKIK